MSIDPTSSIDPLFKYRNSPLQGVEAYRSPFYRRLLSAGYKGYVQGSLGGATLFAGLGLLAGGALAVAGTFLSVPIATGFIAIPIMASAGLIYGKETFGTIGAMAAISAEQAELNEKRRGLLDRYFETPSIEEAKEIQTLLNSQAEEKTPKKWFHWKTGLLGAAVVGMFAVLAISLAPELSMLAGTELGKTLVTLSLATAEGGKLALVTSSTLYALAAGAGGLIGSFAGLDRTYIRKWFDVQENLHDDFDVKDLKRDHLLSVNKLAQAYKREGFGIEYRKEPNEFRVNNATSPISPRALEPVSQDPAGTATIAKTDTPTTHVERVSQERLQQPAHMHLAGL